MRVVARCLPSACRVVPEQPSRRPRGDEAARGDPARGDAAARKKKEKEKEKDNKDKDKGKEKGKESSGDLATPAPSPAGVNHERGWWIRTRGDASHPTPPR